MSETIIALSVALAVSVLTNVYFCWRGSVYRNRCKDVLKLKGCSRDIVLARYAARGQLQFRLNRPVISQEMAADMECPWPPY